MIVYVPISIGELVDKLTILAIKYQHATDTGVKSNILHEADLLLIKLATLCLPDEIDTLGEALYNVNQELWDIEDAKRKHERDQRFDRDFIQLARMVYIKNDLRASIKRQINMLCGSSIIEEKIY